MSATKIAAGDPAKVASRNYKVLLENNRMRALEYLWIECATGEATAAQAQ